jgi:hypothetical protein
MKILQNYETYRAFHNFAKDYEISVSEDVHPCKQCFVKILILFLLVLLQGKLNIGYALHKITYAKFLTHQKTARFAKDHFDMLMLCKKKVVKMNPSNLATTILPSFFCTFLTCSPRVCTGLESRLACSPS